MDYARIRVPAAPVRRKARHQSEMINQLLFGEAVKIINEKGSLWVKIRGLFDNYEGWLTRNLLQEVEKTDAEKGGEYLAPDLVNTLVVQDVRMQVPLGSSLPGLENGEGEINGMSFRLEGEATRRSEQTPGTGLIHSLSTKWLNAPYMWGGRTLFGVDCSGFVQVNYKMMGIDLPRDAWQQAQEGSTVEKLKSALGGDLAFFDDKEEIVHVGILLGNDQVIHASGRVRIDKIDKKGIINGDTGKRSHSLRVIKRLW